MIYKNPAPTVDAIIYSKHDDKLLLIKRKNQPFKGYWALPGGFVDYGESVENACIRESLEETSMKISHIYLFGVYSDPDRDPRGHSMSTVFLAPIEDFKGAKAADDAEDLKIFRFDELSALKIAFDHSKIISDFLKFLKDPESYIRKRLPLIKGE